jgi:hypothetical protein
MGPMTPNPHVKNGLKDEKDKNDGNDGRFLLGLCFLRESGKDAASTLRTFFDLHGMAETYERILDGGDESV